MPARRNRRRREFAGQRHEEKDGAVGPEGQSLFPLPPCGGGSGWGVREFVADSRVHKPHLDEMHGPESLPFRGERALPAKPFGENSRVIQPTNSQHSGPEFGPAPRSSGGAPGKRGGWKKR